MQQAIDNSTTTKQLAIEQECVEMGVARYRKGLAAGGDDSTYPGISLIKRAIEPTKGAITDYLEGLRSGKAARLGGTLKFLDQFDVDVLAFVTCRTAIHGVSRRLSLQSVADTLGKTLEEHLDSEHLLEANPKLYRKFLEKVKERPGMRAVLIKHQNAFAGVDMVSWGLSERRRIGVTLIHLFSESTGLVAIEKMGTGDHAGHTQQFVVATGETQEWLEKAHKVAELLQPMQLPMVCPPVDWTGPFGGGYLTKQMRYPLIRGASRNFLEEIKHQDLSYEYRAVNALQRTAWAINKGILSVMEESWLERREAIGGLPPFYNLELPVKDFTEEEATAKAPKFIQWKRRAAEVWDANKKRLPGQRSGTAFLLSMARKFADEQAIYFPHMMDWRGRKYAVSSFLNPQGNDASKALLRFSESKPLGTNGQYWLAVHGANCFGVDKVAFEERVKWVEDNEESILEAALNPLDGTRWWAQADSPFMFLAFCKEWFALNMHLTSGSTAETFCSGLPVSWDGSCNGLQNFAAMVRDPIGGAAVNLVPGDKPSDVYTLVASQAQDVIDQAAAEGNEVAERWVGKMSRKLAKRNTMTVPYGVTVFGMRDQLLSEYRQDKAKAEDAGQAMPYSMGPDDATYLAQVNYQAIGGVVASAQVVMGWLQKVARIAAEGDLPVHWVTPSGFHVLQSYRTREGKELDITVRGERYRLTFVVEKEKLDKRRQGSGISPNFVHSLDAAHLTTTVNMCLDEGVTSFAMVHDSYGSHAGDADTLSRVLREAFVKQYSGSVLADFREAIINQLPEKLQKKVPPVPEMGNLDLQGVLTSDYFFA